jgi:hypothetical protein
VEAAAAALLELYRKGEIGTTELMVRVQRAVADSHASVHTHTRDIVSHMHALHPHEHAFHLATSHAHLAEVHEQVLLR